MMNTDANLATLDKHLVKEEEAEKALEHFRISIERDIEDIENSIKNIKHIAKTYEGYNLEDEIDEILTDLIYPSMLSEKIKGLRKIADELKEVLK